MKTLIIGRSQDADLVVNDQFVSRRHMQMTVYDDGKVSIKDLGSKTGTFVNGKKIFGKYFLRGNDQVKIGKTIIPWKKYINLKQESNIQSTDDSLMKTKYIPQKPSPSDFFNKYKGLLFGAIGVLVLSVAAYFIFLFHPMKTFNKIYDFDDEQESYIKNIFQTGDDGYILCGYQEFSDDENISKKALIAKIDKNGKKVWSKTFGDEYNNVLSDIVQTDDGGFLAVGYNYKLNDDNSYYVTYLLKTDNEGKEEWTKKFGNDDKPQIGQKIIKTDDGGFLLSGLVAGKNSSDDINLIKIDEHGNKSWSKKIGGSGKEELGSVIEINNGYAIIGSTNSKGKGGFDIWLNFLDRDGEKNGNKLFGGHNSEEGVDILQTDDGYFILGNKDDNVILIKTDKEGNKDWKKKYGGKEYDNGVGIIKVGDGYVIAGTTRSQGEGKTDGWVFKIDETGDIIWERTYGGEDYDYYKALKATSDGGFVILGRNESEADEGFNAWILKLNEEGKLEKK